MNMMGIIFSNIYDERLGEIARHRTLASIPFGARYRLIDFVLSGMVNAGVTNVGVITKQNYQSLMDHLGSGKPWDLDRKVDGLFILPPFGTGQKNIYRGKIEALWGARRFLERSDEEYVLLADANVICNIDYRAMLKEHVASGADISMITKKETISGYGDSRDLVVRTEQTGRVREVLLHFGVPGVENVSIGMYITKRRFLLDLLSEAYSYSLVDFEREILQAKCGLLQIQSLEFKGEILRISCPTSYFRANMALLDQNIRDEMFAGSVYTKILDEVPTRYHSGSQVSNCLLADGCDIFGEADHSVIFRNVHIGKGARVKNCILMQDTYIEDGASLEYAICDKNVRITAGRLLSGAPAHQIIMTKGKVV